MSLINEAPTEKKELKRIEAPFYSRDKGYYYSILEDGTLKIVELFEGRSGLTVITSADSEYHRRRGYARRSELISEEEYCQALQEYFYLIGFPITITLKK